MRQIGAGFVIAAVIWAFPGCSGEGSGPLPGAVNDTAGGIKDASGPSQDTSGPSQDTASPCLSDDECAGLFCLDGACQVLECANDVQCAQLGPLGRCDMETQRCVRCDALDAACLGLQCVTSTDCDDSDSCTENECGLDGSCVFTPVASCCSVDVDCDDGVDCTNDSCKQAKCFNLPSVTGCCTDTSHCNDVNDCTEDICFQNSCIHPSLSSDACTCENKFECDDKNGCTSDTCVDGACLHTSTGADGCCAVGGDCNDGDPGTYETCEHFTCVSTGSAACTTDADCGASTACVDKTCDEGHCAQAVKVAEGCCKSPEDCADAPLCEQSTCSEANECGEVSIVGGQDTLWGEDFDAASSLEAIGWTVKTDGKGALWQVATFYSYSLPNGLYYGTPDGPGYDVGHTSGTAQSQPVYLPSDAQATLSFQIATEIEPSAVKDRVYVKVHPENGEAALLFDKVELGGSTSLAWVELDLDLSAYQGQEVVFEFGFDAGDALLNTGKGVFIDNVKVLVDCVE